MRALHRADLDKASSPVFIQSFELTNLIDLRTTFRVKTRLVFLTGATGAPFDLASTGDPRSYADLTTPAGLMVLAETVTGIGPDKNQVIGRDCAGNLLGAPTTLVADAHAAGAHLHVPRGQPVPAHRLRRGPNPADNGRILDEITAYLSTRIDGFFTDQADIGVFARDTFVHPS